MFSGFKQMLLLKILAKQGIIAEARFYPYLGPAGENPGQGAARTT